jgi:hypothetical protein
MEEEFLWRTLGLAGRGFAFLLPETLLVERRTAGARLTILSLFAASVISLGCQRDPEPISKPPVKKNPPVAGDPGNPPDRPQVPPAEMMEHQKSLAAACKYLWSTQGEDGGWHSEKYGLLKSGQAQTPFVLHALLTVPESIYTRPQAGVNRALDFIRQSARDDGALGYADIDVLEYPNYATSFALRCLLKAGDTTDADLINRMSNYLLAQQYNEARGFASEHPAYGGWGFGGEQPDGVPGHMDLAHTRRVLDAIIEAGAAPAVFDHAQHFLRLVQRHPDDPRPQPAIDH